MLPNLSVAEHALRGSETSTFLLSSFFISSASFTCLSPGLTWLLIQLADLTIASCEYIVEVVKQIPWLPPLKTVSFVDKVHFFLHLFVYLERIKK